MAVNSINDIWNAVCEECKQKILMDCLKWSSEHNIDLQDKKLISIIEHYSSL